MTEPNLQQKYLFYQKMANFYRKMQKIYQEPHHKTARSIQHKSLLNHISLIFVKLFLLLAYQTKQYKKIFQQKKSLLKFYQKNHFENFSYYLDLTILKNPLLNLKSLPFSVHRKIVSYREYKSLWVFLTSKINRIKSVFGTPVRMPSFLLEVK